MLEKLGRKIARGAKAEILEPQKGIDWGKIAEAAWRIAQAGLFAAAVIWSGRSERLVRTPTTIVINNYISKEDLK